MYGSHDMRHTGFPQVDDGQRDPREMGRHKSNLDLLHISPIFHVDISSKISSLNFDISK